MIQSQKLRSVKELTTSGNGDFNEEEQLVIVEKLEELSRCGDFERIFPLKATIDNYQKYLKS